MKSIQKISHAPSPPDLLFTLEELEEVYKWIFKIRKKYSPHSDIWRLCRSWEETKLTLLNSLNEGSYQFSLLDRYEFDDGGILSLWSSEDMMALKLISKSLAKSMNHVLAKTCHHLKGHGGLKKAVQRTHEALKEYTYVFRSDIKSFYASIHFDVLGSVNKNYLSQISMATIFKNPI